MENAGSLHNDSFVTIAVRLDSVRAEPGGFPVGDK
jgi:hypothetical protein